MHGWAIGSVVLNVVLGLVILVLVMAWPGPHFSPPWDGPAVATLVLTAATIMLGAVAVIAGLLAVWGFATLRDHAGSIAKMAAAEAMPKAAEAAAERVVRQWLNLPDDASNQIAEAYGREDQGNA